MLSSFKSKVEARFRQMYDKGKCEKTIEASQSHPIQQGFCVAFDPFLLSSNPKSRQQVSNYFCGEDIYFHKKMPCTITCFLALAIIVAMVIMTSMVHNDPSIQSYRKQLPDDIKNTYDEISAERAQIYYTGYVVGFILSILVILLNRIVLKNKMPASAMVCLAIVVSTFVSYFYYVLSPKSKYMVSVLKTESEKEAWLKIYKSMQYYYHLSFVLGIVAVGVFAYAFRGLCK